ncbi:Tex family protein [Marinitoga aeolica]|uniref:RNA-binding transcriptional accessory protein n=1 Tax=Marinitoga aeolica TaxID=2809031 RepID=A0ABY8PSF5_9BACT|nr:Tex family protein [Marinitoga aeolica]WGS65544.1 RNA-binding transcriptional accessory protein [Marinitoga aeolica]
MNILEVISKDIKAKEWQVKNTIELLDNGNTIPFISRYRKEATGNLTEEDVRKISELYQYYTELEKRKESVIKSIEEQGKLTEDLKNKILNSMKLSEVEDLYLPYKKRKKTKADIAIENGLEPLAQKLLLQEITEIEKEAEKFINDKVPSIDEVLEGVKFIIGQYFAHNEKIRKTLRNDLLRFGKIESSKKKKFLEEKTKYDMYHEFSQEISRIPNYRVLSINRGEKDGVLSVKLTIEDKYIEKLYRNYLTRFPENNKVIKVGLDYGFKNMLFPSISNEVRNILTQRAEEKSIELFSKNLKELLLTPPLKNKRVLAIDPGYRTGCKVVALDESGKFLENNTIYPVPPQNDFENAEKIVLDLIKKYNLNLIVIGNGTASRETQKFIVDTVKKHNLNLKYIFADESGASVYSASKLAVKEFPDLDVTVRGAISIGRRIQDPLAEFVKIDPKSLGVGQYQHDMNQKLLKEKLENTVEHVVNLVGVNLNTASSALLQYISGITPKLAENIVKYREENGPFKSRNELLNVKGFGPKAFEQAAGFLRIFDGENPLEITGIHPESYEKTEELLKFFGFKKEDILDNEKLNLIRRELDKYTTNDKIKELSEKLDIGEYTLKDIISELKKPGRDLRDDLPQPLLYEDVLTLDDLKVGMILQGRVTNITDFGAFVDLGIKENGLIHKSNVSDKFIRHPSEVLSINQIVTVEILDIDKDLKRINLKLRS